MNKLAGAALALGLGATPAGAQQFDQFGATSSGAQQFDQFGQPLFPYQGFAQPEMPKFVNPHDHGRFHGTDIHNHSGFHTAPGMLPQLPDYGGQVQGIINYNGYPTHNPSTHNPSALQNRRMIDPYTGQQVWGILGQ